MFKDKKWYLKEEGAVPDEKYLKKLDAYAAYTGAVKDRENAYKDLYDREEFSYDVNKDAMYDKLVESLSAFGEVISPGLVDNDQKAEEAARFLKLQDVDILLIFPFGYTTGMMIAPTVKATNVPIRLINALSTGGFSLQTTKNGKGQLSVTLTGHVSIDAQDDMPMEFYVKEATA